MTVLLVLVLFTACLAMSVAAFVAGVGIGARHASDKETYMVVAKCKHCPLSLADVCGEGADVRVN